MTIPHIIHQIWSNQYEELPEIFQELGMTWKTYHPDWKYILWDNNKMDLFIHSYYPEYEKRYNNFYFNIQRWDVIRYLILYQMGGIYVDFDYECISPIEEILKEKCCFAMEPKEHKPPFWEDNNPYFNNAFIATVPKHPFLCTIIETIFKQDLSFCPKNKSKFEHVLCTTGPVMLSETYAQYRNKEEIYLIPAEYISPFSSQEVRSIWNGCKKEELEERLQKAVAIHYFMGTWNKYE